MTENRNEFSGSGILPFLSALGNAIILSDGLTCDERWYWALLVTVPMLIFSFVEFHRNAP